MKTVSFTISGDKEDYNSGFVHDNGLYTNNGYRSGDSDTGLSKAPK